MVRRASSCKANATMSLPSAGSCASGDDEENDDNVVDSDDGTQLSVL